MKLLNKTEAIKKMNFLGKSREPFLFVISFDTEQNYVLENDKLENARIFFQTPDFSRLPIEKHSLPLYIGFKKFPVELEVFKEAFELAKTDLDYGNTYLINITQPTRIETNLNFNQIFEHSNAPYKLLIEDKLVVFSPEIFIKTSHNRITSFPMKGTIDASLPHAADSILNNEKETAEHNTIVDLIRNDLSMISKNVEVKKFRYIDTIKTHHKTLLQVSSKIEGQITPAFFDSLGSHLFSILPAGSISGAPKKKTVSIIEDAERYDRGFYTGIFGYFDGQNIDSAVMIRFIEKQGAAMLFKSGGGITALSNCEDEYNELIDKVYLPIY